MMMMIVGKEDLGLSLSLSSSISFSSSTSSSASCSISTFPTQLSLMPSSSAPFSTHQKSHWSDLLFQSSEKRSFSGTEEDRRPLLREIDVNQAPSAAATAGARDISEEDVGASSPNSAASILSDSKRSAERDAAFHCKAGSVAVAAAGDERDVERAFSRGISDEEDGESCRKKLRLSKDQAAILEESFKEHNTLNPKQKLELAKNLNLRPRQVEVWFQNRRARTKLKQTEVDCEFLKRCCENLTEENRRLQKEVQELRALKLSPQLYMHMTPPTTLTMCPSCERVSNSSAAAATVPWAPIPLRSSFLDAPPQRS